jgi:hypothetical protein
MVHRSRILVGLVFLATIGLASPPDAAAQRAVPRGGGHPSGGGGGGGRPSGGAHPTGVAVARTAPPYGYRPYYGYGHYGYGYPRYYYPYAYSAYYYPYYSGFSFSFGFGWPAAYWGGYARPYYAYPYYGYPPYPYAYPYPDYRYDNAAPARLEVASGDAQTAGFGTLSVRTIPPDAVILVDGEAWDRPAGDNRFSIELANGRHQVEIRKEGFRPYVRTVDILGGRTFLLNVSLTE